MPLIPVYSALKKKKRPIILHYAHFFVLLQSISEEKGLRACVSSHCIRIVAQLVAYYVRDVGVGSSSLLYPTESPPFLSYRGRAGFFSYFSKSAGMGGMAPFCVQT